MKYREKPVEVEAIEWLGNNTQEVLDFCGGRAHYIPRSCYIEIQTLADTLRAVPGNFIVRDEHNEFFIYDAKTFEETYEVKNEREDFR